MAGTATLTTFASRKPTIVARTVAATTAAPLPLRSGVRDLDRGRRIGRAAVTGGPPPAPSHAHVDAPTSNRAAAISVRSAFSASM